MQVRQEIKVPREEVFNLGIAEVLDCIVDNRINGIETLRANPEYYQQLKEIANTIEGGKRQLKELKTRFPQLGPSNEKQHQKNVEKLEKEAESILKKLGIDLVMEEE